MQSIWLWWKIPVNRKSEKEMMDPGKGHHVSNVTQWQGKGGNSTMTTCIVIQKGENDPLYLCLKMASFLRYQSYNSMLEV